MDRQDRRNHLIKLMDDGGDCKDGYNYMETRPNNLVSFSMIVKLSQKRKFVFPYDRQDRHSHFLIWMIMTIIWKL